MSRVSVVLALVTLVASTAAGQTTLELDRIGVQQHRDYLRLQPFEQIDTQSSNLVITLTDLVLPGNAGRDLRFQLTYNSNTDVYPDPFPNLPWRFGITGVPMRILQEQSYPAPGSRISPTLAATRDITPILEMADGARHRTVFTQNPITNEVWTSEFWRYHHDTHTLELPDGAVCTYDPTTLRLTQVADVFGNLVTLAWSPGSLQVQQILKNEQPRTVTFAMNDSTGLPTTMTFNDGTHDRVWRYTYEGDPDDSTGRLNQITPPLGPGWRFDYGDFGGFRRLAHLTTPHAGRIDYGYDIKHFVLDGQPELTRALLSSRDVLDRGASFSGGHWSIQCEWYTGDSFCHRTTVQTPSARLTYDYGPLGVAHPTTIIEGPYGLTRITIQDPGGNTTFEDDSRSYVELPVLSGTYRSAELSSRSITRAERTYSTSYFYDTSDANTAQYHCITSTRETGELTRTVERMYTHYWSQPWIPCLLSMERVTVGTEWVRRDFQYDNLNSNDHKGFLTWTTEAGVYPHVLTMTYARDAGGNVASFARRGITTTYGYSGGRQTRVSTALTTTARTVNPDGTVAAATSGGRTRTFEYDDLFRLILTRPPGATNPIITEYDNTDGVWVRETRGTAVTTTTVDGFGRSTLTEDGVGVKTTTEYDAEGRVVFEGYPFTGITGPRIAIEYDSLGRVIRRTNPDNTFSTRTYGPGTVTITDENGHQTVQTWQAFGHPDDARMASVLDADQKLWSYGYHVLGELWTVGASDGRTRTWLYNDQHLLSSETHPESGTTTYGYDPFGRLTQTTDANNVTTTYTYDANNRIQTIRAGSRITTIGYEAGSDNRQWTSSGRIDSPGIYVGSIDNLFAFDDAGRFATRTTFVDGKVFTTQFEYDANDALSSIGYPTIGGLSRRTVAYDFDSERRITRVFDLPGGRDYATEVRYHPSGGITSYLSGNGISTTISYEPTRYWITSIRSGALQLEYTGHDNVGNVTSVADSRGGMNQTFGYDGLDRLTSVNGPYSTQYSYDVHGNRRDPTNSSAYQYDSNTLRLTSQYGVPFTYDNNGNLRTAPGRLYAYTPDNWLDTASVDNVLTAYDYDADGWRLKKVTPAGVTYYLRGLNGELLTEWTNPGPTGVVRDYIYAGSRLVSAVTTSLPLDSGDVLGTLAIGGAPVAVTIATANQNGRLLFNARAGQTVDLQITSASAFNCNWTVTLIAPDGLALTSVTPCSGTSANTGPRVLPATGTYVVLVDPIGSVTGSISVAVTNQSANAPLIASISPTIGLVGTAVTITGTNLTPVTAVRLNASAAIVAASSSAAIAFTVPPLTTSGRISVVTPNGQAVSSDDFFVPPSPYKPSDVAAAGRLNVGSSTTFTIPAPNQLALFVFDRVAGERFTLTISNQLIARLHIQVLRPDGIAVYSSGAIYPSSPYFTDVKVASVTGTYTLVVDPDDAYTGSATVRLADVPRDISRQIVAGGAPVTFTVTTAGQNGRISFVGNAGQRIALTDTNTTIGYSGITIQAPNGSQVAYGPVINNNVIGPVYLPLTGVYNILVNPFDANTGTMTLTLYDVDPDVSQSIPTDGTPITITQAVFQRAYLTFTATVGQHFTGTITGTSSTSCGRYGYVFDPSAGSMYGVFCSENKVFPDRTLTVPGTYTIRLDPNWTATGTYTVRVTLSSVHVTSVSPTSSPVGTTVTVTGTGFGTSQGSSTVTFNGVAATASAWSSSSLTVTVPAGATTGPIVVTVGGQVSNGVTFTVVQPPSISSVNPTSGIVGQSVTISGTNFGATQGNSIVAFNGVAAAATSWSATSITAKVPAAATTGPLVVTVGGLPSNGTAFIVLNEAVYHLHKEVSDIDRLFRLSAAALDSAATTVQSSSVGNSTGEIAIKGFATDVGIPGAAGLLPSGTPLTATVYMRKTTANGVMYPRILARLNSDTGPLLCQATGTTALSSTVTRYVLSCATDALTMTTTDRIYLWVGVNVTTAPGGSAKGELSIEGTTGVTDSLLTVRIPR